MKKVLSIPFAVALLCAVAAAQGPNVALASAPHATAPHGTLTKLEYKQFGKWLADEKAFDKNGSLKEADAACSALGSSTAFLKTMHNSCTADLMVVLASVTVESAATECVKASTTTTTTTTTPTTTTGTTTTPTTTTGTTTTPTVSGFTGAELQEYVCVRPAYEYLSRYVLAMNAADILNRKTGLERGLPGPCLDTMAATTKQLGDEKNMVAAVKRVVADDALLAKVLDGQAAASTTSGHKIENDLNDFGRATKKLGTDSTADKLSTCPHE